MIVTGTGRTARRTTGLVEWTCGFPFEDRLPIEDLLIEIPKCPVELIARIRRQGRSTIQRATLFAWGIAP